MAKYIGKDPNGIQRVWGSAPHADIAETLCVVEAEKYVEKRPDTKPLSKRSFNPAIEEVQ